MPFYAVAVGRKCGVYQTWPECKSQVDGYARARYKKFSTRQEAETFCKTNSINGCNSGKAVSIAARQQKSSQKIKQKSKTAFLTNGTTCVSKKRKQPDDDDGDGAAAAATSSQSSDGRFSWVAAESRPDYSDTVIVYTDGACVNNGFRGAKAGIGVYWGENHPDNVAEPLRGKQTNNRAEIQAVVTAIQQAKQRGHRSVTIRTDSKFLLDSITSWIHKWIKNNWTLSTGGPVKNKEDFQDLLAAMDGIDVRWEKVPAHQGIEGNERADKLARKGSRKSN